MKKVIVLLTIAIIVIVSTIVTLRVFESKKQPRTQLYQKVKETNMSENKLFGLNYKQRPGTTILSGSIIGGTMIEFRIVQLQNHANLYELVVKSQYMNSNRQYNKYTEAQGSYDYCLGVLHGKYDQSSMSNGTKIRINSTNKTYKNIQNKFETNNAETPSPAQNPNIPKRKFEISDTVEVRTENKNTPYSGTIKKSQWNEEKNEHSYYIVSDDQKYRLWFYESSLRICPPSFNQEQDNDRTETD